MSSTTRIHLVRHGTTLLNRANRYRGRRDVPLDAGGWQDAWAAASELQDVGLANTIYSSPCRRARDTARVIADAAGLTTVTDMPGFLNLDYGLWEGLTSDEAKAQDELAYAKYQSYAPDAVCPSGESLARAAERVLLGLRTIALLHPGETIGAVSHAAMLRLVIANVTDHPRENWRHELPNGSVCVFDVDGSDIHLVRMPVAA
jgi:alpha-ribazole phosphatase/probable phosphoglycerate mutase